MAPRNPKKILVIRNDKIGDLIVSSNFIKLLESTFPEAKIDLILSNANKQLMQADKKINQIYTINFSPRKLGELKEYYSLTKRIRKEKYDLGIDLRGSLLNTLFFLFLGKVKFRVGFYTNLITKLLLNHALLKDYKGHASWNMVRLFNGAFSQNKKYVWPSIEVTSNDLKEVNNFVRKCNLSKTITLCVDASDEQKQWPLENFEQLIKYLKREYKNHKIVLVGTDEDKINNLYKKNPECIRLISPNLRFLYLYLKSTNLVITPDGGVMHLAGAAKAKLIAFIPPHIHLGDIVPLSEESYIINEEIKRISLNDVKEIIKEVI